MGKKIVFTNGVFDILHYGHIDYLTEAKALGDVLIVGVNSDSSVQDIQIASRPVQSEQDRLHIVAALKPVDYVIMFSEETPEKLLNWYGRMSWLKAPITPNPRLSGGIC